ncbi:MAG: putative DNA binding domain-containing protein [Thermus sp.]|nr:putative DNA binding domain-containing protein [Thermus sp.]
MTEAELLALIKEGESLRLEFKRDAPLSEADLVEAVACLANTEGGWLLLGVEDDGTISGLHPSRQPVNPAQIQALITNKTNPSVPVEVHVVPTSKGTVLAIKVPKVSGLVGLSDGRVPRRYIAGRGKPECRFLTHFEIATRWAEIRQQDYTAQVLPDASWEDLDPLEFERLRQVVQRHPSADQNLLSLPDAELAQALGLARTYEGRLVPTVGGLLVLGREGAIRRLMPTHEAAFQVLREDRGVVFNEFYREPLLKLFERMEGLFKAYNTEEELTFGLYRVPIPLFPPEAFREALANALVHRDYRVLGTVYVRIDPEAGGLVISNPGGFVEGVTLENLLVVEPRPRNPILADVFKRLGLVERTGRGIDRIFREVLGLGRRPPDYSGSTEDMVKVVLPGGKADLNFVRLILEVQDRHRRTLGWPHLLVLRQAADEGELSVPEVARLIQQGEARARSLVEELVEMGLLEAKGSKKGRVYHLSAWVFKQLGRPTAYVHRRGIEGVRQEELVMQMAYKYRKVTRGDVLQLFPNLTEDQAFRLLQKLVQSGRLRPKGSKRGRYYEPAE